MFEGGSAETCTGKFPLMFMGGRAEGPACTDPGERTPIGVSEIFEFLAFTPILIDYKYFCLEII